MKLLTLARDLQRRKARERQSLFVAEGIRVVEELLRSPLSIRGAIATQQLSESSRGTALLEQIQRRGILTEEVGAEEFSTAAETESGFNGEPSGFAKSTCLLRGSVVARAS
jgi:TrmH family RNA methyltransferase